MVKQYRNNGAICALLDEYEKAVKEMQSVILTLSETELKLIVDRETRDPHCVSIQSILSHVVRSGYNYINAIRIWLGEKVEYRELEMYDTPQKYYTQLKEMFVYNEKFFLDYPDINLEEYEEEKKIKVRWGQRYDVEQLIEHAIVHILRHRRQIERFILKIRSVE